MQLSRAFIALLLMAPLALVSAFSAGYVMAEADKSAAPGMAAARGLITATGAAKAFDTVVPTMVTQLEPLLLQAAPGTEKEVREILALMVERFSQRKAEMLETIAGIYASKLSEPEMKDLTAYFSQGAGATFIARQPEILTESMAAGQKWGQKIGVEIEQEIRNEFKKRGIEL